MNPVIGITCTSILGGKLYGSLVEKFGGEAQYITSKVDESA